MWTGRLPRAALAATCGLAVAVLAACSALAPPNALAPAPPAQPPPLPAGASLADVAEKLAPSVVTVRLGSGGLGSGVIYKPDVILTNQHVVESTRQVTIDFADGTSADGRVLATDPVTDLAVIRSARAGLPVPEYRVQLPRPGDPVLVIGSPLGFENTVTAGIVSALNRQIPGSAADGGRALVDLIQVDAAISPGNSGGALLDGTGRVIGINEAYIPPQAGAVSLGFAIPAATAVDIADQLLATGTATHPVLGVSLRQLTPEISSRLGMGVEAGALVLAATPGGPAAAAGVQAGDVIVGLGDRRVGSVEDLLGALRRTQPGQQVPVELVRGQARQTVTVTIGSETG